MTPLTTGRLLIRRFCRDDATDLMRVFGDPEVMRYGDGVQTAEWIRGWLDKTMRHYEQQGFGPYAVMQRESKEFIGYCGLFHIPDVNGKPEIEIGYRLARAAWGKGFATEAARAVRDYAFTSLGIRRLIAIIDPSNVGSIRVAEKLGMRYEADVMFDRYTHPDHVYATERESI